MAIAEELQVIIRAEVDKAIRDMRSFNSQMDQTEKKAGQLSRKMNEMGRTMTRAVTLPILGAAAASVKFAADIERQQTAFGVLLQDVERGNQLFQELKEFSAETPLSLEDITKASQTLLAFGTNAEEVQDQIRQLGDVAQGNAEKLDRITLAFGKIQARGKASMEEINVLIEAGVPIIAELAKNFGVAESEIFNMVSAGQVGFSDIQGALESLTGAGGQFEGMMEKISQTTAGKFSTALDNVKLAAAELGAELLPMVNSVLDRVTELAKGFSELDDETKKIILTAAGVAAAMGPVLRVVGSLGTALTALAVPPTGIIIAAISAVALLGAGLLTLVRRWKENNEQIEMSSRLNEDNNVILRNTKRAIDDVKLAQIGNIEAQYAYLQSLIDTNDAKEEINDTELEYLKEEAEMLQEILDQRGFLNDRDQARLDSLGRQISLLESDNEKLSISNELIEERIASLRELMGVEEAYTPEVGGNTGGGSGDAGDASKALRDLTVSIQLLKEKRDWYNRNYGGKPLDLTGFAEDYAERMRLQEESAEALRLHEQKLLEESAAQWREYYAARAAAAQDAADLVVTTTGAALAEVFDGTPEILADIAQASEAAAQRIKEAWQDAGQIMSTIGNAISGDMDPRNITRSLGVMLTDIIAPGMGQLFGGIFDLAAGLFDMFFADFNDRVADATAAAEDFVVELDDSYETEIEIRNRYIDELNSIFGTEFDILKDAWDRNLISTSEFRAGMGDLNNEYAAGAAAADDAAATEAAQDLEDARKEKIDGLQAQIDRLMADWDALSWWAKLTTSADEELKAQIDVLKARIDIAKSATTLSGIQAAANGADFMTNGPQLLLVGDNASGREHVRVTPAEGGGGSGTVVNVNGPVYGVDDLGERVYEALDRAKRRGRIPA